MQSQDQFNNSSSTSDVVKPIESEKIDQQDLNDLERTKLQEKNAALGNQFGELKASLSDSASKVQQSMQSTLNAMGESIVEMKNVGVQRASEIKDRISNAISGPSKPASVQSTDQQNVEGFSVGQEQQQQAGVPFSVKMNQAKDMVYDKLSQAGDNISYGAQVASDKMAVFADKTVEKAKELKNYTTEQASNLSAKAKAQFATKSTEPSSIVAQTEMNAEKPTADEKIGDVKAKVSDFENKIQDQSAVGVDESVLGKRKLVDEPEFLQNNSKATKTD